MKTKVCLGLGILLLAACGANEDRRSGPGQGPIGNGDGEDGDEITLQVASAARDCVAEGDQRLCLLVRESDDEEFTLFHDVNGIANFDYQWGFTYELRVLVFTEADQPSDGSRERYNLVDVVSQEEDQPGTTYELSRVVWYETDVTFRRSGDNFVFLGQEFSCASSADCEGLYGLGSPGAEVNLTFRYLGYDSGDAPIELVGWE